MKNSTGESRMTLARIAHFLEVHIDILRQEASSGDPTSPYLSQLRQQIFEWLQSFVTTNAEMSDNTLRQHVEYALQCWLQRQCDIRNLHAFRMNVTLAVTATQPAPGIGVDLLLQFYQPSVIKPTTTIMCMAWRPQELSP